ncbi:hypothetical protein PY257_10105 [Ramlibacter sp. H39-3-26]|uniref:hypothetical protein n=1 Tax=Curvibacter soli TaxID=3031331 RepID=UPI0023DB15B8|nr:hypothetical protein [Ramlibacter sp. H39-3-26]MDF1485526.1 hypothetical protein [Ramlibacter sp. H39-3-26]
MGLAEYDDGRGVPSSLVVTGANTLDMTQIEAVRDAIAVKRPLHQQRRSRRLCADAGYPRHHRRSMAGVP